MNKDNKDNNITGSPHVGDLLPGYIDSSLPTGELDAVRAHLEGCDACRADYDDLQTTRRMLQQMPMTLAPRAFTITEEMASRVRKPSLLERIFVPRLAPTFAGGSVVAFVLLVFLFATSNAAVPVSSPQTMTSLSAQVTESSTPVDGTRINSNADIQPNSGAGTEATTAAGEEPTVPVMGAAPNSDAVPSSATPDPHVVTSAQATREDTASSGGTSGAFDNTQPSAKAPESITVPSGLANEPGMTTYSGNYTAPPPVSGTSILELGLLALGVALAAAAIIARRRI